MAGIVGEVLINRLSPNTFENEGNNANKVVDALNNVANKVSNRTPMMWLMSIVNWIIFFYAIYLSFKCNKGFNFLSFLAACCCSYFYVAYRLAVPCK